MKDSDDIIYLFNETKTINHIIVVNMCFYYIINMVIALSFKVFKEFNYAFLSNVLLI